MKVRKTVDSFEIHVQYEGGWEHEITEFTFLAAKEQKKTYMENCNFPVKIVRRRIMKSDLSEHELQNLGIKV